MASTITLPVTHAEPRHNSAGTCWALTLTCGHAAFRPITSAHTGEPAPAPRWAECAECPTRPRRA